MAFAAGTARTILGAFALSVATIAANPANSANAMRTGGLTSQPIGHYEFCKALPAECTIRPSDNGPVHLSRSLWNRILKVNVAVNRSIRPMNDYDIFGKDEVWTYPNGVGDCEDYVLQKRRVLMNKGIPLSNLLITVVRKRNGEGHAVLTVRTDRGDFVLDNLTDAVVPWNKTGYRFLKRQASNHTGRWVTIRGDRSNSVVGAVR